MINKIYLLLVLFFFALPASAYVPSDPLYRQQDYLQRIKIEKAWDVATGDGVVVAVLDSGVDINHPDLKFNIWKNQKEILDNGIDDDKNGYIDDVNGWDFVEDSPDPTPKFETGYIADGMNHGTAISGIIAATGNNGKGMTGVAFGAKIMPLRILSGNGEGDISNLVKAIKYAVNNGADIINLSIVGYDYSGELYDTIVWAKSKGVLVISAVGNAESSSGGINLTQTPSYPACYDHSSESQLLLGVASVDNYDIKSKFSNYGSCVDLTAPGENLFSLGFYSESQKDFNNYYSYNWSGTSLSTALVTGVAALVKSNDRSLGPSQIISALVNNTDNIDEKNPDYAGALGSGRLNAQKAVNASSTPVRGSVVKLKDLPAVYYLDSNEVRHFFPNEKTYWSWYSGSWSDQGVRIISQEEFDSLSVGKNVAIRPGTKLIRFENSPRVYAVTTGYFLCQIVNENSASASYGNDWKNRVAIIGSNVEMDYNNDGLCRLTDQSKYSDGSLIKYQNSNDIWYIEKGLKRPVSPQAFLANNFKEEFIVKDVKSSIVYETDRSLSNLESSIFVYYK